MEAPQAPPKMRLVVCCDGTWNDSISTDSPLTNVSRISRLVKSVDEKGVPQVVYYHTGVGSGTSQMGNVIDGMSGRGISANIRDAYTFICHNYTSAEDEIILIGFSRGAFTVRAIASLINDVGLLTKTGLKYLGEVYNEWKIWPHGKVVGGDSRPPKLQSLCRRLQRGNELRPGHNQPDIMIKVCAVWDTVGSLGFPVPDPFPQKASKRLAHVNSRLCGNIEVAVQALALNERRKHFQATVWEWKAQPSTRILKQCWFLGAHSDVGGGNKDAGLASITLVWMIAQLSDHVSLDHDLFAKFAVNTVIESNARSTDFSISVNVPVSGIVSSLSGAGIEVGPQLHISGFSATSNRKETFRKNAGKVQESMRGVFLLGGSRPRKPRQYLMNEAGLYKNDKQEPTPTLETIHWTVRVLLGIGYSTCSALDKYATNIEDSKVIWNLFSKSGEQTNISLAEDEFDPKELDLLERWMIDESGGPRIEVSVPLGIHTSSDTITASLADILIPFLGEAREPRIAFSPGKAPSNTPVSVEIPVPEA